MRVVLFVVARKKIFGAVVFFNEKFMNLLVLLHDDEWLCKQTIFFVIANVFIDLFCDLFPL